MTGGHCLLSMTNGFTVFPLLVSTGPLQRQPTGHRFRPNSSAPALCHFSQAAREYIVNSRDGAMRFICYAFLAANSPGGRCHCHKCYRACQEMWVLFGGVLFFQCDR